MHSKHRLRFAACPNEFVRKPNQILSTGENAAGTGWGEDDWLDQCLLMPYRNAGHCDCCFGRSLTTIALTETALEKRQALLQRLAAQDLIMWCLQALTSFSYLGCNVVTLL